MQARYAAMRLEAPHSRLARREIEVPPLRDHEVLLDVLACGVCRTDLHVMDGEIPGARYPVTPGHEIVGRVAARGSGVKELTIGERVGVPWLGWSCGACAWCRSGRENLCDNARFTGCHLDGGYAERVVADARYCLRLPRRFDHVTAAPLLCAGLIGYRAYVAAGDAPVLGIYGFGSAAHLIAQVAVSQGRRVFAFTRPGDESAQRFAGELGAEWAGSSTEPSPVPLDAAILFAPVGALVPTALASTTKGGRVVCAGIHMSDIPSFPYSLLWGERRVLSVANLTRNDGREFMALAEEIDLRPVVDVFRLAEANDALARLREGTLVGTAVLVDQ